MTKTITAQEIREALDKGNITLVEALPEKYYLDGHLPGAVQINHDEVKDKAAQFLPNKDAPIVTYCSSDTCPNSGYAAEKLSALGYTNVRKYAGGKQDWAEKGFELVQ